MEPRIINADPEDFMDLRYLLGLPSDPDNTWRHRVNATLRRYGKRLAQQEMRLRALEGKAENDQ